MRFLILLPLIALAGCGSITRTDYEQATRLPVIAEHEQDGETVVVYGPDCDPRIKPDATEKINYECPTGVRVAVYRDGVLVRRWFQRNEGR